MRKIISINAETMCLNNKAQAASIIFSSEKTLVKSISKRLMSLTVAAGIVLFVNLPSVANAHGTGYTDMYLDRLELDSQSDLTFMDERDGTIGFGETINGSIDAADEQPFGQDGPRADIYRLKTAKANQRFHIAVESQDFGVQSLIFFADPATGQLVFMQTALTADQNGQPAYDGRIEYAGTAREPGEYWIFVTPSDSDPLSTGKYRIRLTEGGKNAGVGGSSCQGGSVEDPIQVSEGQPVSCALTQQDISSKDGNGGVHYAKIFTFQGTGAAQSFTVNSNAFTPILGQIDPASGNVVDSGQGELNKVFPAGPVFIVVIAREANAVGPFNVKLSASQSGGGFGR